MIAPLEPMTHPAWYIGITLIMALVPILLGTTTSYLKVSLALGVLRNGFGAQQVPNNAIIMVLSLVLSIFIMQPVAEQVLAGLEKVTIPSTQRLLTRDEARPLLSAFVPWRDFLAAQSGDKEIAILRQIAERNLPTATPLDEPIALHIVIPAFVLTELKEGITIGFVLLLPFLVVDLVVANILAGLGMYMMSPTIISLPLKLLLFVSVDGWLLISRGFIASYS